MEGGSGGMSPGLRELSEVVYDAVVRILIALLPKDQDRREVCRPSVEADGVQGTLLVQLALMVARLLCLAVRNHCEGCSISR